MKLLGLALFASSLLVVPAAFSQDRPINVKEYNRPTAEQMVNRHVERLALIFNLTPEQKQQATTYFTNAWNSNKDARMQIRTDRKALENDVKAKADQAKLTEDAKTVGQDEAKLIANDANAQAKFLSLLNPQEQAKYDKLEGTFGSGVAWGPNVMAPGALYR